MTKVTIKSFKEMRLQEALADNDPIFHEMWTKYVPQVGKADTVLGEIIRAVGRIVYRWYNDGDQFNYDYGVETAGSSAVYLMNHQPVTTIANVIRDEGDTLVNYESFIDHLQQALLDLLHNDSKVQELASKSNSIDSVADFSDEAKRMFPEDEDDDDGWY